MRRSRDKQPILCTRTKEQGAKTATYLSLPFPWVWRAVAGRLSVSLAPAVPFADHRELKGRRQKLSVDGVTLPLLLLPWRSHHHKATNATEADAAAHLVMTEATRGCFGDFLAWWRGFEWRRLSGSWGCRGSLGAPSVACWSRPSPGIQTRDLPHLISMKRKWMRCDWNLPR